MNDNEIIDFMRANDVLKQWSMSLRRYADKHNTGLESEYVFMCFLATSKAMPVFGIAFRQLCINIMDKKDFTMLDVSDMIDNHNWGYIIRETAKE